MSSRLEDLGGHKRNRLPAERCTWHMPVAWSHLALMADSPIHSISLRASCVRDYTAQANTEGHRLLE
jgi:hypothetical protein